MTSKSKAITGVIVSVLVFVNIILSAFNLTPFDISEDSIMAGVSVVMGLAGTLAAAWYNLSVTPHAVLGDTVAGKVKSGELTVKQILDAIEAIKMEVEPGDSDGDE